MRDGYTDGKGDVMAQVVGYFEDNVVFTEGPFVIVNPLDNGWRIEVDRPGSVCPVLPDGSIYDLIKRVFDFEGKTTDKAQIEVICNYLNELVKLGRIVPRGGSWIYSKNA